MPLLLIRGNMKDGEYSGSLAGGEISGSSQGPEVAVSELMLC